jgi:hypothetical protein
MPYARIVQNASRPATAPIKSHAWQVLREAAGIEPDEDRRIAWYRHDPIAPLDMQTAESLVSMGRYRDVLDFLQGVRTDLGTQPSHGFGAF